MTPQYPRPSAHNVITGFFDPNHYDARGGLGRDFGTTIAIMAQDKADAYLSTSECNNLYKEESEQAKQRASLF